MIIIDEAHNLEQKILGFTDFEISPFTLQRYSVAIPSIEAGDLAKCLNLDPPRDDSGGG